MAEEATGSCEPKALSLEELNYARKAALYVLSTHSSEEAVRIFTHGLKPVLGIKKNFMDFDDEDDAAPPFVDDHNNHRLYGRTGKRGDVATAPF